MKVARIIIFVLLLTASCYAQNGSKDKRVPDQAYLTELARLVTGLQKKNPWMGWEYGTEMTVTHLGSGESPVATTTDYARWDQHDQVFKILEKDKLWTITSVYGGVGSLSEFNVEGQAGYIFEPHMTGDGVATVLEIDGLMIPCRLYQSSLHSWFWQFSTFTVMKYWTLAGHPSVLLRLEHKHSSSNGFEETTGWTITSSQVKKKIGDREFQCVEMKDQMRISGDMNVHTTQYLSPDVPGHLVEMINEFYKVGEPEGKPLLYMVTHQKVTALKLP